MSRAMDRQPEHVRKWARLYVRAMVGVGDSSVTHGLINERAALEARCREVEVGGRVAVVREGHDCDCSSYVDRRTSISPRLLGLAVWQRLEDQHREWLDGPERTYFERPGAHATGHWSRDCALESYEETGQLSSVTINSPDGAWE